MSYALDEDDPNIPILIRDGWTLQSDGSWISPDKQSIFSRVSESDARRVMFHPAPKLRNGKRLRIIGPFPTPEQIAKKLGVSKKRLAELRKILDKGSK